MIRDWNDIVERHAPEVARTAWRLLGNATDAEDCVQDAFLTAWRAYQDSPVDSWQALLQKLVVRRAIDQLRRRRFAEGSLDFDPPHPQQTQPETEAIESELKQWLRSAIARLSPREAEVVSLRCFAEMSNLQIAEALRIRPATVGVLLMEARGKLIRLLPKESQKP